MKLSLRTVVAAALVAMTGAGLSAQAPEKFTGSFKVRVGYTDPNTLGKDMHASGLLGMGVGFSFAVTDRSSIISDLTYTKFASTPYANPILSPAVAATSGDLRKNKLDGFSARLGYRSLIGDTKYNWQAGLVLDRLKSRQEASGQLTVGANVESISAVVESTKIRPGIFAGVFTNISEEITLECNLLTVGYSQVNWMPQTYSGTTAAPVTTNRLGVALEVALGLRF